MVAILFLNKSSMSMATHQIFSEQSFGFDQMAKNLSHKKYKDKWRDQQLNLKIQLQSQITPSSKAIRPASRNQLHWLSINLYSLAKTLVSIGLVQLQSLCLLHVHMCFCDYKVVWSSALPVKACIKFTMNLLFSKLNITKEMPFPHGAVERPEKELSSDIFPFLFFDK